jgi:hypothetical protein
MGLFILAMMTSMPSGRVFASAGNASCGGGRFDDDDYNHCDDDGNDFAGKVHGIVLRHLCKICQ